MRTTPRAFWPSTMFRPLNSAMARSTVRRSAPSTSRLKLPVLVRLRPTVEVAEDCAAAGAAAGATTAASIAAKRMPRPVLLPNIRVSLPHERNHHLLALAVRGDVHHHGVAPERLDVPVLQLVTLAQHVAVATHVLDHGELIRRTPHDADDLHAARVRRGAAAHLGPHEIAADGGFERV